MKNKPTLTNSNRNVHMAIFEQTKESGATWFSTTLKRPYKNRQGQWEHGSYNLKQLEALVELAQQAIRFITESEQTKDTEQESAAAQRTTAGSDGVSYFFTNTMEEWTMDQKLKPMIYVACLAAYNAGHVT